MSLRGNRILRLREVGIIDIIRKRQSRVVKRDFKFQQFTFSETFAIFVILITGLASACFILALERIVKCL